MIEKAKKLQAEGHTLILWTCRTGELLKNAVDFLKTYGLTFNYVNDHNVAYVKAFGEGGKKVGADYYVDDKRSAVQHTCTLTCIQKKMLMVAVSEMVEL